MSDKERLEEIVSNALFNTEKYLATVKYKDIEWIASYAKEQAERVNELEIKLNEAVEIYKKNLKYRSELETMNTELDHQNKRYREALEFYADEDIYEPQYQSVSDLWGIVEIRKDKGKKARQALEGESE